MDKGNIALEYPTRHLLPSRKGYLRKKKKLQNCLITRLAGGGGGLIWNFCGLHVREGRNETGVSSALRAQSPPESSQPCRARVSYRAVRAHLSTKWLFFFFIPSGTHLCGEAACENLPNTGVIARYVFAWGRSSEGQTYRLSLRDYSCFRDAAFHFL